MTIELTPQTIVTAGAVVTAAVLLVSRFAKGVRWFDKQEKQSTDIAELRDQHNADIHDLKGEQQLLTYGVLACLKGLRELGCNGPVTEAVNKIEKYLNQKAHEQ